MYCNRCQVPQQPSSQCLSTSCLHLFCIKCAKDVFDAGYECPVCGTSLTRSSIKLVKILSENTEELSLALAGQAPEVACQASETAVRFYVEQVNLASQVKDRSHKKKVEKIQLAARHKLGEFSQVGRGGPTLPSWRRKASVPCKIHSRMCFRPICSPCDSPCCLGNASRQAEVPRGLGAEGAAGPGPA